jgi:hypothetical protein
MSRRGGKRRSQQKRNTPNCYGMKPRNGMHWQTADINERTYYYYIDIISRIAMSRFRWLNLPKTCDERFLERCLCYQGVATIAFPKKMRGTF